MKAKDRLVCEWCGVVFEYYASQKVGKHTYCSDACARLASRTRLEIHCRWCDKLFTVTPTEFNNGRRLCSWSCRVAEKEDAKQRICETCDKPFRLKVPSGTTRTCSKECAAQLRTRGKWQNCESCGTPFWAMPCQPRARFCSRVCSDKAHGLSIRGENSPCWHGGTGKLPYPYEWTDELKTEIRQRDGEKCMECSTTSNLSVHHIDYDKMNCAHSNLITLCNPCNARANFNRKHWQERYQSMVYHSTSA